MPSEQPGSPDPLSRLADTLAEATGGARPTPRELAELLWLARQMEPDTTTVRPAPPPDHTREPAAEDPTPFPPPPPDPPQRTPEPAPAPLHLPAAERAPGAERGPHASFLAPTPPMLRHPLALQRALRPLKRRTDAPVGRELDEQATADRIARLGAAPEWWLPVLRPARERWLRLNLVYDTGPTMPVWRPLIRELHTALAQSGVFRTVTLQRAEPDGTVRGHGAHAPADGRTVTLLVSDCMGPQWRQGPAGTRWYGTLHRWARRMPVAVVQPLPERLWRDTALPTTPGRLSAPHPVAPATALAFTPYDTTDPSWPEGTVPLPVLEPGPDWLANWASLIASPGRTELPAAAAPLDRPLPADADDRTDVAGLSAEELVLRFRATASPEAFRLAGHLALARPDLPVMRLVQAAVEPDPRPRHLAEVILSGMLTTVAGPPGSYAFRPGVRDLLLRGLPRTAQARTAQLLRRMGGLIDARAGRAPGEFRAATPAASGTETAVDGAAIATVSAQSVRQLGGGGGAPPRVPSRLGDRYRLAERLAPNTELWRAQDMETDRAVAVRLLRPFTGPERRAAFLRAAARLQDVDDPHVVAVHDFGFAEDVYFFGDQDVPYVVMEHVDGIPLDSLATADGYRLPEPLLVSVAAQLARAVVTLHDAGVTHGGLTMSRLLLLPDGTVKLTLAAPGRTSGPEGRAEDRRALAELLLLLAAGTSRLVPPVRPPHLAHVPAALRRSFAEALNNLLSRNRGEPMTGLGQLLALSRSLAREVYDQRFYYLLGPPRVEGPDGDVPLSPELTALLVMLLLKHGRTVTHAELGAGLWGPGDEPGNARTLLGRWASRLRTLLGPGALATLPDGYALHTSADFVDLVHCERLVAGSFTDLRDKREAVAEALRLWRSGEPLAGVPGPAAQTARTRLLRLRLGLHRQLAELDLELGEFERVERATADLTRLVRDHPSREDFRRLLMTALRRQGRIAEALDVYQEYRIAGGTNPELLMLGRELREEYSETPGDGPEPVYEETPEQGAPHGFVAAPDELPEGPFPTEDEQSTPLPAPPEEPPEETPLPQNDVPDSLFAVEEAPEEDFEEDPYAGPGYDLAELYPELAPEQAPPGRHVRASYLLADSPPDPEAFAALGRAVLRLLSAAGLETTEYRVLRRGRLGYVVHLAPGVPAEPLFTTTMHQLSEFVGQLGGSRLRGTFWCVSEEGIADLPDEQPLRLAAAIEAHSVIAVAPSLRDELGYLLPSPGPDPSTSWSILGLPSPRLSPPLVHGPYDLPADLPFPEPLGETRTVVYLRPDGTPSLTRTPDAVRYYEVDLTERRTQLDEPGPPGEGVSLSKATGEAVWRVTEPVEAIARFDWPAVPDLVRRHMRSYLQEVPLYRSRSRRTVLSGGPERNLVPGCTVHWSVSLSAASSASAARSGPF